MKPRALAIVVLSAVLLSGPAAHAQSAPAANPLDVVPAHARPEGWIALGELYMMDGRSNRSDHDLAVSTLTNGAAANPKNGMLPFLLCRTYYEQGRDLADALRACQQSVAIDPSDKFAWDYAAWSALQTGNAPLAIEYWRRVLVIDPHYTTARIAIQRYGPRT